MKYKKVWIARDYHLGDGKWGLYKLDPWLFAIYAFLSIVSLGVFPLIDWVTRPPKYLIHGQPFFWIYHGLFYTEEDANKFIEGSFYDFNS